MSEGIHPEVLRLLGEILGDDSATLTRISRMRPKKAFPEVLSAGEAFLSKRERHLVEWHREEVARLLYEGSLLALQQAPVEESGTIFEADPLEEGPWFRARARVLGIRGSSWPEETEALRRIEERGRFGSQWARLAVSLTPNEDARLALGCALASEGNLREARKVASGILSGSHSSRTRSRAHSILGNCHYRSGELDAAMGQYRSTAMESNPDPSGPLTWFAHTVRIGDTDQILLALERIRSIPPIPESVVARCEIVFQEERRTGAWPAVSWKAPTSFERKLDEPAWRILHAIR